MEKKFVLKAPFKPAGSQPQAIKKIVEGYDKFPMQTLLGITGSGKTMTMASSIEKIQKPTLILAHNKTLAAQLYQEFKEFFPDNAVEYFISYFDYYQPESYLPTSDTFIEKESTVNEQIEKMRLKTMMSLRSRNDVIVVASISCIYGAGDPNDFDKLALPLRVGEEYRRADIFESLVNMLYERNDMALEEGKFRVRGETIDIFPAYGSNLIRLEFFGDELEGIYELDFVTGEKLESHDVYRIFPTKQYAVSNEKFERAINSIKAELDEVLPTMQTFEAERLKRRTKYDIEMMEEMGFCSGIENYSRHFENREPGTAPHVLLDFFPEDFFLIIDESHQTIPQSHGMYNGDYSRKKNLVDFGFRLPSAYDNRPLKFEEFEKYFKHTLFVSATPAQYELDKSGQVIEQIIRPTGLLDPIIEMRPSEGQVKDLLSEVKDTVSQGFRVLVTTLTKKMAEELTNFYAKEGIKVRYLHSDIDSLDRIELIRDLRAGDFDVLVGINLLREGLDIPEVALVAILDADKEGFLRNERSLIQTIGRAARNDQGKVIMYADKETMSIREAIMKTQYRREKQIQYNKEHGIVPKTVIKKVEEKKREVKGIKHMAESDVKQKIADLEAQMAKAAENLDFETAIKLRDTLEDLKRELEFKR
ncbi:MAG: excinuclease ABC subunit UvrB [Nanoarchaeota archaeon]|nr:excinuclease ABC subunit UvrB [Nanoarchaeota archaeon]